MAVNTITIGLAEISLGDIESDGGMSTSLETWGFTEEDSCKFTIGESTSKDYIPEELEDPIFTQETPGDITIDFTIMDPGTDTLERVLGGTLVTTGTAPNEIVTFHAPSKRPIIEKSLKIIARQGLELEVTRARITASMDSTFGKNGLFTVKVKAKILVPTKALESSWRMRKITV